MISHRSNLSTNWTLYYNFLSFPSSTIYLPNSPVAHNQSATPSLRFPDPTRLHNHMEAAKIILEITDIRRSIQSTKFTQTTNKNARIQEAFRRVPSQQTAVSTRAKGSSSSRRTHSSETIHEDVYSSSCTRSIASVVRRGPSFGFY